MAYPAAAWAAATGWVLVLGTGGGLATRLDRWYYELRKPPWQPPDWLFGPVWTTIFVLGAWAALIGWYAPEATPESRTRLLAAYAVNSLLNVTWSLLFFRLHRPDWALAEVALLWVSIAAMMVVLWPVSRVAALMIAPYLLWVSFASVLNTAIVRLNRPFGTG